MKSASFELRHRVELRRLGICGLLFCLVCLLALPAPGYSLLTHEEIVDILWQDQLQPLLLKKFPGGGPEQLRRAHAYAYGGSLIQDLGYYPFGSKFFSDLTHYVRTGDFVANLLSAATNRDEYAFALGALAHYTADNEGHPFINSAVALSFPKLRRKYGNAVTYEECPRAHIQTEFGFDITQVAKNRYTSDRYHDFVGFDVATPLLDRAFVKTYGLPPEEVLGQMDLAIGTFRFAASQVIPEMTRAALTVYHPELVREVPDFNKRKFLYNLSHAQFETEWGREYRRPGLVARLLGWLVRWVPKVGALRALAFEIPTPQTEDLYVHSVNLTVAKYRRLVDGLKAGVVRLPDTDCDTGQPTLPGEYKLCDQTYAKWLDTLARRGFCTAPPAVRENLLAFYANPAVLARLPRRARRRAALELAALKAGPDSLLALEIHQSLFMPPHILRSPKALD